MMKRSDSLILKMWTAPGFQTGRRSPGMETVHKIPVPRSRTKRGILKYILPVKKAEGACKISSSSRFVVLISTAWFQNRMYS